MAIKDSKLSKKELKKLKPLSKGAMAKIKKQVLKTIGDTEMLLESLNNGVDGEPVDYEGGYAYIEENLRQITESLGKLSVYDEHNCEIWSGLANVTLDTLGKAMKQYESFAAQNKIPQSLVGIGEYISLGQEEIRNFSKLNKCNIRN